jgi:HK97 family phage prohead protease
MTNLISVDQFRKELREKRVPSGGVYRVGTEPPELTSQERTLRFCFSDDAVDLMGDTIAAAGWDLANFLRNPVALWAHDSSAPPIGSASNVGVEGNRLLGDIAFAPLETYAFADTIYRLLLGKFLRAVSVGFLPTKHLFVQDDPARPWGIDFLEQSLLEISVCPVPANPNALAEARRKGIDTRPVMEWAERTLDGGGKVILPRKELERLRIAAKEPPMTATRTPRSGSPPGARSGGASEVDPTTGGALVASCGRKSEDECGMTDPSECAIHAGVDPNAVDDDKRFAAALRRLIGHGKAGTAEYPGNDDLPLAHEDAIRVAHKCLRTSKAFMAEAANQHTKALSLLDGVVDALDTAPDTDPDAAPPTDPDAPPPADKAAQHPTA